MSDEPTFLERFGTTDAGYEERILDAENAAGELECLDGPACCAGAVEYRLPMSSTGRSFPRREKHFDERLDRQEETNSRYGGDEPPSDFDPTYAGERWSEDY